MPITELAVAQKNIMFNGRLTDADVLDLRRLVFGDVHITMQEADSLFRINGLDDKPETWYDLFTEAVTHFLVRQTMPHGYINQANAAWLMARIDHDGVVESRSELELLLHILKTANNVTDELERYALEQVTQAVVVGRGYLSKGRKLQPGELGEAEVDLLRQVLYSCSSEGGVGISRSEAEFLFDLNDALENADNAPSWQRLFVGGIANHLMMVAAWNEPDAQEALRRENWLNERGAGFVVPSFNGLGSAFKSMFVKDKHPEFTHTNTAEIGKAEKITVTEASWLVDRLNRDGHLSANEKALLQFLAEESPDLHESLIPYVNAA